MAVPPWQRQLLSTLTRLEEGQRGMREDIQTLTRVIARRFGTTGSSGPQVGDHVLYYVKPSLVRPAVVLDVRESERLDLEVFGEANGTRFPRNVPAGHEPGSWRFPG